MTKGAGLAGADPLPTPEEAVDAPLSAFPSWLLRMECATCGRERYINEVLLPHWHDATLRVVARLHHEGRGGRPKLVELVTGIEGASRPVRRVLLLG
jgi:hypothetical protein